MQRASNLLVHCIANIKLSWVTTLCRIPIPFDLAQERQLRRPDRLTYERRQPLAFENLYFDFTAHWCFRGHAGKTKPEGRKTLAVFYSTEVKTKSRIITTHLVIVEASPTYAPTGCHSDLQPYPGEGLYLYLPVASHQV